MPGAADADVIVNCSKSIACSIMGVLPPKPQVEYTDVARRDAFKRHRRNSGSRHTFRRVIR
jgi:hypothetical protein